MISIERHDNAVVIQIKEPQLQMYIIPQFKNSVKEVLDTKPKLTILDMTSVDHMDSSAMGALFHFQKVAQEHGGTIALAHVNNKVMQVLKITKSDKNFEIFESVEKALRDS